MFEVVDIAFDLGYVLAEAEDLLSARRAVVCLLEEGQAEVLEVRHHGHWLESCQHDEWGNPCWTSNDLIRRYDGRAGVLQ